MPKLSGKQIKNTSITSAQVNSTIAVTNATNTFGASQNMGGFNITNLPSVPVSGDAAASKTYVDTAVSAMAAGLDVKDAVDVATNAVLPANTRTGNTLTASADGALPNIDTSYVPAVGRRVLVKNETPAANNGIYIIDSVGSPSTRWSMTRSSDADNSPGTEVTSGLFTCQIYGAHARMGWFLTTADPIVLNVSDLTFSPFALLSLDALSVTNTPAGNISSTNVQAAINELDTEKVAANVAITGATKTKITYDAKGLVTAGIDATTADVADSTNRRYITDAQLVVVGNTSGTNTGDVTVGTTTTAQANGASIASQVLHLSLSDASNPGLMTAANFNKLAAITGTNTGDVTLTAIGSTPNANGASLTGQTLNLQPANDVYGGVLNTTAQTIAGVKTFTTINGHYGLDASGTVGAVQVDAPTGIATIAAGATTCVVTNNLATAFCKVTIEWYGDHGATRSWVVRAAGSFTVALSSAATANTSFGWEVSGMTSTVLSGLLHYWALDGNSNDAFVTGNGTDTAVTYTMPKLGSQCAYFDGLTSKVQTSVAGPLSNSAFSFSIWVSVSRFALAYMYVAERGAEPNAVGLLMNSGSTTLRFYMPGGERQVTLPSLATWYHIVATFDGTTSNLYLNGGTPVSGAAYGSTTNAPITLGCKYDGSAFWYGLLDDACMWSRALTSGEVATLYNSGAGLETMSGSLLTNLIHQWHFNGNSNDNIGSANGTDTAIVYGGKAGYCAFFNGSTSCIQTASLLKPSTWSVNCWLRPSTDTSIQTAWTWGTGGSATAYLARNAGTATWQLYNGVTGSVSCSITNSVWSMVTITYDGANATCYANGVLVSGPTAHTISASSAAIRLGCYSGPSQFLLGMLDEVAMWNRPLTAAEITNLYNAGVGRFYPAFA